MEIPNLSDVKKKTKKDCNFYATLFKTKGYKTG